MNLNHLLHTQHADYERDLEPPDLGLDDCPFDDPAPADYDLDVTITRPCHYCGFTDCNCLNTDSPYDHLNTRHGL